MIIRNPGYKILSSTQELIDVPLIIEEMARVCYKSEGNSNNTRIGAENFIRNKIRNHESIGDHGYIRVKIVCDRSVSHELVRHRIGIAICQESQRYVNYLKKGIEFIKPWFWAIPGKENHLLIWENHMMECEKVYNLLIHNGSNPEEARLVLPNSTKTELNITVDITEWRHIFTLRAINKRAYSLMRQIMVPLLLDLNLYVPSCFEDLVEKLTDKDEHILQVSECDRL